MIRVESRIDSDTAIVVQEQADAEPRPDPEPLGLADQDQIVALVMAGAEIYPPSPGYVVQSDARSMLSRATERMLTYLAKFDGTWRQRWIHFEEQPVAHPWWLAMVPPGTSPAHRQYLSRALGQLVRHDVVRPSYEWMQHRALWFLHSLPEWRDPDAASKLEEQFAAMGQSEQVIKAARYLLGSLCAHTGRSPSQIRGEEVTDLRDLVKTIRTNATGCGTLWTAMHSVGWFGAVPPVMPHPKRRVAPRSIEQHVDYYKIRSPHREVLIEYLKTRVTMMDYSSFRNLVRFLIGNFWQDVSNHHPDLPNFAITPEQTEAWKERLKVRRDGKGRRDLFPTMIAVRGFYLDMSDWALTDSYWAQWVARCPINKHETRNLKKQSARSATARMQERTRNLVPLLPALVQGAEDQRRRTLANLDAALSAGAGGTVRFDGTDWLVKSANSRHSVRVISEQGKLRFLAREEERGFWTWAIIEILRHSGLRMEEMLELTHLAIQPYTIKLTGETIPLLHIVPSKNDEERLVVASPELVHVLTAILARLRTDGQTVPLTQRWDPHERILSDPLPHLMVHHHNSAMHVLTPVTVHKFLAALADELHLQHDGEPIKFTPHDFRRIFATEALANGLPPHIVQVLLGHRSLSTTQGYTAIYPQDVIRAHRSFITTRRRVRPSEEYREPTPEEWAEFEAHFVQRKVSLGTCGRAYGTNCQHEHACLRCGLLRPDPAQADRLRDIVSNLQDRIDEAEENNWFGEVEGLKVSLDAARLKLEQMDRQAAAATAVDLGFPVVAPRHTKVRQ